MRTPRFGITGATLKAAIANGLSRLPNPSGRFPPVSGLAIEADASRPLGSRVLSVKVGDAPLDPAKTYSLTTNDFVARRRRLHELARHRAGAAGERLPDHRV